MQSIEGLSSCLFVWDKMSKNNLRIVFEDRPDALTNTSVIEMFEHLQ